MTPPSTTASGAPSRYTIRLRPGGPDAFPDVTIPVRFNGSAALIVTRPPSAGDAPNLPQPFHGVGQRELLA